VELYIEDVIEAGDEKDFIPRPAPMEEWLKFFKAEAENIKELLLNVPKDGLRIHEVLF